MPFLIAAGKEDPGGVANFLDRLFVDNQLAKVDVDIHQA